MLAKGSSLSTCASRRHSHRVRRGVGYSLRSVEVLARHQAKACKQLTIKTSSHNPLLTYLRPFLGKGAFGDKALGSLLQNRPK